MDEYRLLTNEEVNILEENVFTAEVQQTENPKVILFYDMKL